MMAEGRIEISFHSFGDMADAVRVVPEGVLDLFSAEYFRMEIARIKGLGFRYLVIDLCRLDSLSDAGCGVLAAVCGEKDSVIINAGSEIKEIIELLGFDRFLRIAGSPEEAMSCFRKVFPVIFPCPSCGRKLRGVRAGRFRCPACRTALTLDQSGSIISSLLS